MSSAEYPDSLRKTLDRYTGAMGRLTLTGLAGYLAGQTCWVERGQELIIGRSRSCGLSLRKSPRWVAEGKREAEAPPEFRAVSRRHVKVRVLDEGRVEITALGVNGTFVDGVRIDTVLLTDLAHRPHELALSRSEKIRIEWDKKEAKN